MTPPLIGGSIKSCFCLTSAISNGLDLIWSDVSTFRPKEEGKWKERTGQCERIRSRTELSTRNRITARRSRFIRGRDVGRKWPLIDTSIRWFHWRLLRCVKLQFTLHYVTLFLWKLNSATDDGAVCCRPKNTTTSVPRCVEKNEK